MNSKTNYEEQPHTCNLCGGKVILIKTGKTYSRSEYIYKCIECGASVCTQVNQPKLALGTLADYETKKKRREVHTWFDKLWDRKTNREETYVRLAKELGIPREDCHFGLMQREQLEKALVIIKKWWLEKFDK